jgi:hypothetical protein
MKKLVNLLLGGLLVAATVIPLAGCDGGGTADAGNGNDGGSGSVSSNKDVVGFQVVPSSTTVSVGDTFTVEVVIDTDETMTRGAQCGLVWTPAGTVDCLEAEMADYYADWGAQTMGASGNSAIDNEAGKVANMAVYCTGTPRDEGPSGKGVLFRYQFEAVSAGTVSFTVSGTDQMIGDVLGTPIEIESVDATVTVQ